MKIVTEATSHYNEMFASRTEEELRTVAQIKRFMERLVGDADFRKALGEHNANPKVVAEAYGIEIDPADARPLFSTDYLKYRRTEEAARWPLTDIWDDWLDGMRGHRDLIREVGRCPDAHPTFDAWRERQIARCDTELGTSAHAITHPIIAYELSQGCSVGCWFCGISADRFKGWAPYSPEIAALWRGVLGVNVDLFGAAAQTGFCYWATDPADNPDYPKFIEDHYHVTGALPQTTTAAPLKDVALTRQVMALFDRYRTVTNRFSIVNFRSLKQVHEAFTAEELLGVELVQQHNEALTGKASAGRARERRLKMEAAGKADKLPTFANEHGTIACVSGFLLNMMDCTVKLVAPTRSGDVWPLGYRVYEEASFETAEDYRAIVEGMIERYMPNSVAGREVIAFRNDLTYRETAGGFELETGVHTFKINGAPWSSMMGHLIAKGTMTASQIANQTVKAGGDVFLVYDRIQEFFDLGLLNDDPALGGVGSDSVERLAS
jgi:radical SAM family RiPP maturation amino acid epimerase